MDFSLASKSVVSSSHKRHRDAEVSASRKRTKTEIQPLSAPKPTDGHCKLLNQLTFKIKTVTQHMMEWLAEKDMLQLMISDQQLRFWVRAWDTASRKAATPSS